MSKRPLENEENACVFFLEKKKRRCRFKTEEGMTFCPHHAHLDAEKNSSTKGKRIPCPYDSEHFCYLSKLKKHLKKCNARPSEIPVYYSTDVNMTPTNSFEPVKMTLADVTDEYLMAVIKKVKEVHSELREEITEVTSMHPIIKSEMEKTDDGFNSFKHMKQIGSLLSLMEESELLKKGSCFVEFGAGKGQLMYWIVKCVPEVEKKAFVLVDKSAQRHKCDSKFKDTEIPIQRLRIDIQNLHLGKVPNIQDKFSNLVAVCKHLCGRATDLAIKSTVNTLHYGEDDKKVQSKALGLLMALCCHHRCTWNAYVDQHFMERNGIYETYFRVMCCMASWATCSLRKPSHVDDSLVDAEPPPDPVAINRYLNLDLSHDEREKIGIQCKQLIDAGRVSFLRKQGYDTKLITYTDKDVSLENLALLAVRRES